jgi:xylulose-5-phosphate/fructose-6-phosphate phosphoketolase
MCPDNPVRRDTAADDESFALLDAYWRAANYLSVGQIYLMDIRLLREPLRLEHIKPRLLGHWGTTPGQNFIYAHMNRAIKTRGLNALYVSGPGHGGPGVVANTYLEGTYSETYSAVTRDEAGMKRLFTQFSFPGDMWRRRRRVRSMKGVSWAIRCCMPMARCSTIRACWPAA